MNGPKILPPGTVLELIKLWPNARKQGHEKGEIWRIGYYSKQDGLDIIWLVDANGEYNWTVDREFVEEKFKLIDVSKERSLYGNNRPPLGKLDR